jgi:GntR family transcriptional regulator
MQIRVNFKSSVSAYRQIVDQVMRGTASGALRDGDSLPPIRMLAEDLRINRNTVAKAYSELQREGVVESVQGRGVFITANHSPLRKQVRQKLLAESIDAALVQAHHFQIDSEEFLKLVNSRIERISNERKEQR